MMNNPQFHQQFEFANWSFVFEFTTLLFYNNLRMFNGKSEDAGLSLATKVISEEC